MKEFYAKYPGIPRTFDRYRTTEVTKYPGLESYKNALERYARAHGIYVIGLIEEFEKASDAFMLPILSDANKRLNS